MPSRPRRRVRLLRLRVLQRRLLLERVLLERGQVVRLRLQNPHRSRLRNLQRQDRDVAINCLGASSKVAGADIQTSWGWSIISAMRFSRRFRKLGREVEDAASPVTRTAVMLRNIGLLSAGVTVVAIGVMVGREMRQRYKFNRRTPYDAYAHAGDERQVEEMEFGLGT